MKIPADAIIPPPKLTRYLLISREQDDKSKFLAQAGFTQDNPQQLEAAIRQLADTVEAVEDVEGELIGVNETNLSAIAIWLKLKLIVAFGEN